MTKGLHLKPKMIIFDCSRPSVVKFIESRKNRITVPIKIVNRNNSFILTAEQLEDIKNKVSKEKEDEFLLEKFNKKKKLVCNICKKEIRYGETLMMEDRKPVHPVCVCNK